MTLLPSPPIGIAAIRASLTDMPSVPGVYRMLNEKGDVLYVGKAKNLKNRVTSYAQARQATRRIMLMVASTAQVEIVVTGSEAEALLLEANMIKKLKPRYNILLRDDKSFPYIFIDTSHDFPRIEKHRGAQSRKGDYFGPFAGVGSVNKALDILQKVFLLRPCSDSYFAARTRPCLQYQIKRCSAPCVAYINKEAYGELLDQARQFLHGKNREVQEAFVARMAELSASMQFEQAALMRDRIRALTQVQQEQGLRSAGLDDADVIALSRSHDFSCIQVFFFRGGHHFGNQSYFPRHDAEETEAAIMAAFLGQFYQSHTPPREILLSHQPDECPLLEEALSLRTPYRVTLRVPERGDKAELVRQAGRNAEGARERRDNERMGEKRLLEGIGQLFALPAPPQRIEVYDNSHIMGRYALGGMIVAGPEGFDKKSYRRFNIRDVIQPGDDYAMMREVFTRRFGRLKREDPQRATGAWPDLVLIDGGRGQLAQMATVLDELGIHDMHYAAIAKGPDRNAGREDIYLPGAAEPFSLPPNDPLLHYLQRLRDEAHRFAIGSHRVKRAKSLTHSALDDIPGIGSARKKALLHHFGSRRMVERATLAELEKVEGISRGIAQKIYDYFHG